YNDSQAPGCCDWYCFDLPCNPGDHEGDWTYLDVYVRRSPPNELRFIVYHHHGDGHCRPWVLPWDWPLPSSADGNPAPECFLEEDSHEWWPKPSNGGECTFVDFGVASIDNDPHDGLGGTYRTENVLNVGEPFAPMPGIEPQILWFYNGR